MTENNSEIRSIEQKIEKNKLEIETLTKLLDERIACAGNEVEVITNCLSEKAGYFLLKGDVEAYRVVSDALRFFKVLVNEGR
jgi:hypothetical protein